MKGYAMNRNNGRKIAVRLFALRVSMGTVLIDTFGNKRRVNGNHPP